MTKRGFKVMGAMCPNEDCGSVVTSTVRAGMDDSGRRLRQRRCANCKLVFTTIELAVPYTFWRVDTVLPEKDRIRRAGGRTARKRFDVVGRDRVVLGITAKIIPAKKATCCRKGLHEMTEENTYVTPATGKRQCRACRRISDRAYKAVAGEYIRRYKREWEQRQRDAARAERDAAA